MVSEVSNLVLHCLDSHLCLLNARQLGAKRRAACSLVDHPQLFAAMSGGLADDVPSEYLPQPRATSFDPEHAGLL